MCPHLVEVELVCLAAEATDILHLPEQPRLNAALRPLHLVAFGRPVAQLLHLVEQRLLDLLRRVPGLDGRGEHQLAAQHGRVPRGADVLRDLPVVDEVVIEAARLAGAQNADQDPYRASLERPRPDVPDVDPGELHRIVHDLADFFRMRLGRRGHFRLRRPTRNRPEVLLDQQLHPGRIEVADDGHRRIVGRVVGAEEVLHVLERGLLQVLVRADHVAEVRVRLGIEQLAEPLLRPAVGDVLDALPLLVADDIPLRVQLLLIDGVEEEAHAIALEPQRKLQPIGGHCLEVVGAIPLGGAVQVRRAVALEHGEHRALVAVEVLRALEHEVLEEVREPAAPLALVDRAHVVPDVHGSDRRAVVLGEDDRQPVGELVLLEGNTRLVSRGGEQKQCRDHGDSLYGWPLLYRCGPSRK